MSSEHITPEVAKEAWETVVKIYDESMASGEIPEKTMDKIIDALGRDKAVEVFAVISKIKKHDGRIYGENRKWMDSIDVDQECVLWERSNPMLSAGLDAIHTTHIDQLITELRKRCA